METIQKKIADEVAKHKILLYVKGTAAMPMCGFSRAVIEVFKRLEAPFETVDVLADPEIREGIKQYTQWPTIPQIFIGGKFIGGCDIVREMYQNGELEPLVKQALATPA